MLGRFASEPSNKLSLKVEPCRAGAQPKRLLDGGCQGGNAKGSMMYWQLLLLLGSWTAACQEPYRGLRRQLRRAAGC